MAQRYDTKQIGQETYAVVHIDTGEPVELNGVLQIGFEMEEAQALAQSLELIAEAKHARAQLVAS